MNGTLDRRARGVPIAAVVPAEPRAVEPRPEGSGGVGRATLVPWLVAASPGIVLLVVTFFQLSRGWAPLSDDAVIATRAWDVLSRAVPLVGQATLASGSKGQTLYDLGPLYYFFLTLPEHASPTVGPLLGSAAIWLVAAYGLVAAARSVYGLGGLLVASFSLLVFQWQVPAVSTDPLWNPHAAVMWFLCSLASLLAVVEGNHRWYPFATFAASFAIQANIVTLVPMIVLWVVATASVLPSGLARRNADRRSLMTGTVVGVLCWIPPLAQEVVARTGNLSSWIWYFSHHTSVGLSFGLESMAAVVDPRVMFAALQSHSVVITSTFVGAESPIVGLLVLGLLVLLAAWAYYHERRERYALGAAALVALSMTYTFASMPPRTLESFDYLSVVLVALASVLWALLAVAAAWTVAVLAARRGDTHAAISPRPPRPARLTSLGAAPYLLFVAVLAMLLPRVVDFADTGSSSSSRSAVDETTAYVEAHVPRGPVVVGVAIDGPRSTEGFADYADSAGAVWELRVAGWRPEIYGALWSVFGPSYAAHRGAYVAIGHVSNGSDHVLSVTIEHPQL